MTGRRPGGSLLVLLAVLAVGLADPSPLTAAAEPRPIARRVLMLFQEAEDLPANLAFEHACRSRFEAEAGRQFEFQFEYIDASRFPDEAYHRLFFDYLREKYRERAPDVIVLFVTPAYVAMESQAAAAFPGVPLVHAIVDQIGGAQLPVLPGATGVVGRVEPESTVELILHLYPTLHRLYVLGGVAPFDRALSERVLKLARTLPHAPEVELLEARPLEELRGVVAGLPVGSALLFTSFLRDPHGQAYTGIQVISDLAPRASVPSFVMFDLLIGTGVVGGAVLSLEEMGVEAARIALRVLDGVPVTEIAPTKVRGDRPAFDARVLRRWRISAARLPADSIVRFRQVPFWRQNLGLLTGVAAVILAETMLIAGLLVQLRLRRRAEAALVERQRELAHLSRVNMVSTLSTSMAHELSQPLAAILSNSQAGLRFLAAGEPDLGEIEAILTDIVRDDKRAGAVIAGLRSMLRHEAIDRQRLDLDEVAREMLTLLNSELLGRRIEVEAQLSPGSTVLADRVQMQQVLLNLLMNAIEAMDPKPANERKLGLAVFRLPGDRVRVAVSDTGVGVGPEELDHLFDAFWTTKKRGLGIGLALCRSILEAHLGKIWVERNVSGGATFYVELPGADAAAAREPEPSPVAAEGASA